MFNISARDLLKGLTHFKNEFDIINPANDDEVYAAMEAVGMDTRKGVSYDVAYHRDRSNTVAVGFMLSSEYNLDPKFRKFHDNTDRIVLAYMQDPSLGRELDEISGKRFAYRNDEELEFKDKSFEDPRYYSKEKLLELGYTGDSDEEDTYDGQVAENYDVISSQIETMKSLLKIARGE